MENLSPILTPEARAAVRDAFEAMASWHTEIGASSDKVVAKMANAARAVGWPEPIVDAVSAQVRAVTRMQTQMMEHFMGAWEEQIKSPNPMANFPTVMMTKLQSWPGLASADAFNSMSTNPMQFWTQMGEQWQKNWAQTMTLWSSTGMPKDFFGGGRR